MSVDKQKKKAMDVFSAIFAAPSAADAEELFSYAQEALNRRRALERDKLANGAAPGAPTEVKRRGRPKKEVATGTVEQVTSETGAPEAPAA